MKKIALALLIIIGMTGDAEDQKGKSEKEETKSRLEIKFFFNDLTEGETKIVEWKCEFVIHVIDEVMTIAVFVMQDFDPNEKWQPREFNSKTHKLIHFIPAPDDEYYNIGFEPKDPNGPRIWPSDYTVNKEMFEYLKEHFETVEVQRIPLRIFTLPEIKPRERPKKMPKPAPQPETKVAFFSILKNVVN